MADLPISSATALTHSTIASGDLFPVLDISAASGSKGSKITLTELTTAVNATLLGQANTFTLGQTINAGTVTVSTPILAGTQTWNDGAVAFTALDVNVTNTASAAGSLLMNLRVGGSSVFGVTTAGDITNNGGAFGNFTIGVAAGSNRSIIIAPDGVGFLQLQGSTIQSFSEFKQRGTTGFGTARNSRFRFASIDNDDDGSDGAFVCSGSGAPEGVKTAPPGSIYLNQAGGASTSLYYKASGTGNTGWSAVA